MSVRFHSQPVHKQPTITVFRAYAMADRDAAALVVSRCVRGWLSRIAVKRLASCRFEEDLATAIAASLDGVGGVGGVGGLESPTSVVAPTPCPWSGVAAASRSKSFETAISEACKRTPCVSTAAVAATLRAERSALAPRPQPPKPPKPPQPQPPLPTYVYPCKNGKTCKFKRWNRCLFNHDGDDVGVAVGATVGATATSTPTSAARTSAAEVCAPSAFECSICFADAQPVAFGCGHMATCTSCANKVEACPICRKLVELRIPVFL